MTIYHVDAVDPDDVNSSHALVLGMVEDGTDVLDVGCATGYLGAALTARGCTVTGVEVDPDAARAARQVLVEVLEADLDRDDLGEVLGDRRFDTVVLADVLEHLHDPVRTLRAAVGLLRPGGGVVVSIPNVTHGSLRLALLAGSWRYADTGLLDRTHVRFFDRAGLVELLHAAGLEITEFRSTVLDPLATDTELDDAALPGAIVDWVRHQPDGTTYQFVARAVVGEGRQVPRLVPAIDLPPAEDEHTARARRAAALEATSPEDDLEAQVVELRHALLVARDHALGAEAENGRLLAELDATRRQMSRMADEIHDVHTRYGGALDELAALRESATWRLSSAITGPLSALRRGSGR